MKSRETLKLLEQNGIKPEIVEYLKNSPSVKQLKELLTHLKLSARDIIRCGEPEFKQHDLGDSRLTEMQLLQALHEFPKLIERPIVVIGKKAVLGRPPENILELI